MNAKSFARRSLNRASRDRGNEPMASLSELYFSAEGLAHTKGVDQFKKIMTIDRARKLYLSVFESKGYSWVQEHFVEMLVNMAGREQRQNSVPSETYRAIDDRLSNGLCEDPYDDGPDEYPGGYSDYGSHQQARNRRGGCSS